MYSDVMGRKLDLGELTEEEEKVILGVIKRDYDVRRVESTRIEHLSEDVKKEESKHKEVVEVAEVPPDSLCAKCGSKFMWLINPKSQCSGCELYFCKNKIDCITYDKVSKKCFCSACVKQRELTSFAGAWFYSKLKGKFRRHGGAKVSREIQKRRKSQKPESESSPPLQKSRLNDDSTTSPSSSVASTPTSVRRHSCDKESDSASMTSREGLKDSLAEEEKKTVQMEAVMVATTPLGSSPRTSNDTEVQTENNEPDPYLLAIKIELEAAISAILLPKLEELKLSQLEHRSDVDRQQKVQDAVQIAEELIDRALERARQKQQQRELGEENILLAKYLSDSKAELMTKVNCQLNAEQTTPRSTRSSLREAATMTETSDSEMESVSSSSGRKRRKDVPLTDRLSTLSPDSLRRTLSITGASSESSITQGVVLQKDQLVARADIDSALEEILDEHGFSVGGSNSPQEFSTALTFTAVGKHPRLPSGDTTDSSQDEMSRDVLAEDENWSIPKASPRVSQFGMTGIPNSSGAFMSIESSHSAYQHESHDDTSDSDREHVEEDHVMATQVRRSKDPIAPQSLVSMEIDVMETLPMKKPRLPVEVVVDPILIRSMSQELDESVISPKQIDSPEYPPLVEEVIQPVERSVVNSSVPVTKEEEVLETSTVNTKFDSDSDIPDGSQLNAIPPVAKEGSSESSSSSSDSGSGSSPKAPRAAYRFIKPKRRSVAAVLKTTEKSIVTQDDDLMADHDDIADKFAEVLASREIERSKEPPKVEVIVSSKERVDISVLKNVSSSSSSSSSESHSDEAAATLTVLEKVQRESLEEIKKIEDMPDSKEVSQELKSSSSSSNSSRKSSVQENSENRDTIFPSVEAIEKISANARDVKTEELEKQNDSSSDSSSESDQSLTEVKPLDVILAELRGAGLEIQQAGFRKSTTGTKRTPFPDTETAAVTAYKIEKIVTSPTYKREQVLDKKEDSSSESSSDSDDSSTTGVKVRGPVKSALGLKIIYSGTEKSITEKGLVQKTKSTPSSSDSSRRSSKHDSPRGRREIVLKGEAIEAIVRSPTDWSDDNSETKLEISSDSSSDSESERIPNALTTPKVEEERAGLNVSSIRIINSNTFEVHPAQQVVQESESNSSSSNSSRKSSKQENFEYPQINQTKETIEVVVVTSPHDVKEADSETENDSSSDSSSDSDSEKKVAPIATLRKEIKGTQLNVGEIGIINTKTSEVLSDKDNKEIKSSSSSSSSRKSSLHGPTENIPSVILVEETIDRVRKSPSIGRDSDSDKNESSSDSSSDSNTDEAPTAQVIPTLGEKEPVEIAKIPEIQYVHKSVNKEESSSDSDSDDMTSAPVKNEADEIGILVQLPSYDLDVNFGKKDESSSSSSYSDTDDTSPFHKSKEAEKELQIAVTEEVMIIETKSNDVRSYSKKSVSETNMSSSSSNSSRRSSKQENAMNRHEIIPPVEAIEAIERSPTDSRDAASKSGNSSDSSSDSDSENARSPKREAQIHPEMNIGRMDMIDSKMIEVLSDKEKDVKESKSSSSSSNSSRRSSTHENAKHPDRIIPSVEAIEAIVRIPTDSRDAANKSESSSDSSSDSDSESVRSPKRETQIHPETNIGRMDMIDSKMIEVLSEKDVKESKSSSSSSNSSRRSSTPENAEHRDRIIPSVEAIEAIVRSPTDSDDAANKGGSSSDSSSDFDSENAGSSKSNIGPMNIIDSKMIDVLSDKERDVKESKSSSSSSMSSRRSSHQERIDIPSLDLTEEATEILVQSPRDGKDEVSDKKNESSSDSSSDSDADEVPTATVTRTLVEKEPVKIEMIVNIPSSEKEEDKERSSSDSSSDSKSDEAPTPDVVISSIEKEKVGISMKLPSYERESHSGKTEESSSSSDSDADDITSPCHEIKSSAPMVTVLVTSPRDVRRDDHANDNKGSSDSSSESGSEKASISSTKSTGQVNDDEARIVAMRMFNAKANDAEESAPRSNSSSTSSNSSRRSSKHESIEHRSKIGRISKDLPKNENSEKMSDSSSDSSSDSDDAPTPKERKKPIGYDIEVVAATAAINSKTVENHPDVTEFALESKSSSSSSNSSRRSSKHSSTDNFQGIRKEEAIGLFLSSPRDERYENSEKKDDSSDDSNSDVPPTPTATPTEMEKETEVSVVAMRVINSKSIDVLSDAIEAAQESQSSSSSSNSSRKSSIQASAEKLHKINQTEEAIFENAAQTYAMENKLDQLEESANNADLSDPSIKKVMKEIEAEIDKAEKQMKEIRRGGKSINAIMEELRGAGLEVERGAFKKSPTHSAPYRRAPSLDSAAAAVATHKKVVSRYSLPAQSSPIRDRPVNAVDTSNPSWMRNTVTIVPGRKIAPDLDKPVFQSTPKAKSSSVSSNSSHSISSENEEKPKVVQPGTPADAGDQTELQATISSILSRSSRVGQMPYIGRRLEANTNSNNSVALQGEVSDPPAPRNPFTFQRSRSETSESSSNVDNSHASEAKPVFDDAESATAVLTSQAVVQPQEVEMVHVDPVQASANERGVTSSSGSSSSRTSVSSLPSDDEEVIESLSYQPGALVDDSIIVKGPSPILEEEEDHNASQNDAETHNASERYETTSNSSSRSKKEMMLAPSLHVIASKSDSEDSSKGQSSSSDSGSEYSELLIKQEVDSQEKNKIKTKDAKSPNLVLKFLKGSSSVKSASSKSDSSLREAEERSRESAKSISSSRSSSLERSGKSNVDVITITQEIVTTTTLVTKSDDKEKKRKLSDSVSEKSHSSSSSSSDESDSRKAEVIQATGDRVTKLDEVDGKNETQRKSKISADSSGKSSTPSNRSGRFENLSLEEQRRMAEIALLHLPETLISDDKYQTKRFNVVESPTTSDTRFQQDVLPMSPQSAVLQQEIVPSLAPEDVKSMVEVRHENSSSSSSSSAKSTPKPKRRFLTKTRSSPKPSSRNVGNGTSTVSTSKKNSKFLN